MTDPEAAGSPEPRRKLGWRQRAAIGGGAILLAVLAAGAAFLAFGPVGFGPGPLSVGYVSSSGTVPPAGPAMIVIPVGAAPSTTAVIDRVVLRGGGGYRSPHKIRVVGITGQSCRGIWFPLTGPGGFQARCAAGGTVPLLGRAVPGHPAAAAIDIGIEVGPPGPSGCWHVGKIAVSYHVGHRHYVNVAPESLSGCTSE